MRWLRPKNVFSEVIGGDDSCCLGGDEHVGGQGGGLRRSPGRSPISFYRTLLYIILHIYLQKCTVIWFSDTITKMQEIRTQNSFGFDSTNTQGHAIPHLNMMLCPFWVLFSKRLSLWTCIRSDITATRSLVTECVFWYLSYKVQLLRLLFWSWRIKSLSNWLSEQNCKIRQWRTKP